MAFGMKSLSSAGMKQHPALVPLMACLIAGAVGSSYYLMRLATRNPDVSWNKKKNAEPWQEFEKKQYKFFATRDYSTLPDERPKF